MPSRRETRLVPASYPATVLALSFKKPGRTNKGNGITRKPLATFPHALNPRYRGNALEPGKG